MVQFVKGAHPAEAVLTLSALVGQDEPSCAAKTTSPCIQKAPAREIPILAHTLGFLRVSAQLSHI